MAGHRFILTLSLVCGSAAFIYLMPVGFTSTAMAEDEEEDEPESDDDGEWGWWWDPTYPDITLEGRVRDFRASHEDMGDVQPDHGYGHYAGNISQVLGNDNAPLQVHGVTDFQITFGTLVPGQPYAARATVLGSEITSGGDPIPVTIQCETDTQLFEPYGAYNDPGGSGDVNDGANPRHFIFALDEIYSAETPISVTATSWLPSFGTDDFGYETVLPNMSQLAQEDTVCTKVTLPEDGTVTSITAYFYRDSADDNDIGMAIYADDNGEPGALIVEALNGNQASGGAWETMGITDTFLTAGDYWLAMTMEPGGCAFRYESGVSGQSRRSSHNSVDNGFAATWLDDKPHWNDRQISIFASYTSATASYNPHITARSGDNSQQVIVLKDGDDVPSIDAFADQTNLAVFVAPFVNVTTGKIQIQDNQAIYLFELGTTNISSSAADFQDLVIMVTLATDPVYFLTPDSETQGFNPIGFKVADQWMDSNGREIAPHMYLPSWGDTGGISGPTSSGGINSPSTFYEWFRDILGANMSTVHEITLKWNDSDAYEYITGTFLPINGQLYGNENGDDNWDFSYTIWARFIYDASADQFFEFQGGDGCWIYLEDRLLIDLGGVDSQMWQRGQVDRMGFADGQEVTMRLFYANRGKDKMFKFRTNVYLDPLPVPGTASAPFD